LGLLCGVVYLAINAVYSLCTAMTGIASEEADSAGRGGLLFSGGVPLAALMIQSHAFGAMPVAS